MIRIITITNPIQVDRDREQREIEYSGYTLEEVLRLNVPVLQPYHPEHSDLEFEPFDDWSANVTVSVNGNIWPRSLWTEITPEDEATIVIFPVIRGGSLLRTLASVALLAGSIALVATGAGAALAPFLAGMGMSAATATATSVAILSGAVNIAGNLIISAVLGPNSPSNKTSSASYDPDGPQTLAQSGVVIPKGCGTMMWGGNIIASFTDLAGSDEYINLLVCFGFGPARSIRGLQLNGKDISSYQNVQYYTRLGTNDQTPIGQFNQISNGYAQDTQCLAGVPVVVPGTGDLTQALQVDISFPDGIFVNTNDGNIILAVITYLVEFSVSGSGVWQPVVQPLSTSSVYDYHPDGSAYLPYSWGAVATDLPASSGVLYHMDNGPHTPGDPYTATETITTYQPNGNHADSSHTVQGEWQLLDPTMNYVAVNTWTAGYQDFVAAQTTPCYNRTQILGLAPNKYDVRITKYGCTRLHDDVPFGDNWSPNIGQDMWVHSVNEIQYIDLAYPNMILIGIRALATSQLSGANIKVGAIIEHGLRSVDTGLMPAALQAYEEDNPACVAVDMMIDDLYGGGAWPGITPANITRFIDEWIAYAENNDTLVPDGNGNSIRLNVFNGVFDNEDNLWNQLSRVGAMSRAAFIPMGLDYGVFLDTAVEAPVQMFTMGNILMDSFSEIWLPIDERANQVEIQFADATRYYKSDNPIVYMDPAQQDAGTVIKNTRIKAVGVTSPAQAWHLARYKERGNQFLLRTGSFRTDTDGIACRPGNVIALQHDVPQWGYGGRTLPGSTATTLILDRNDLPTEAGVAYSVMVQHSAVQRYAGVINTVTTSTSPVGLTLALSSFDGTQRITRIVCNGFDAKVLTSAAGQVTIPTPLPSGIAVTAGMPYQLFDTDVMESVAVAGVNPALASQGSMAITLATPLTQVPDDYSLYIYGPTGSTKWVRVTQIKKASEFKSTIEWIDYDADVYTVATPTVGETSAVSTSNPGVTTLVGAESFNLVGGSYASFANLSWRNGPDTVGVGIYVSYPGQSMPGGLPQLISRLTGSPTSAQLQVTPGTTATYTVVGFDVNDVFASFTTAPTVTITAVGVATNLLLGSSFASGFAYWNITPGAGDTFLPDTSDDGEAIYTVAGTTLASAQPLCYQVVPATKWAVGDYLMLSGYVEDTAVAPTTAPNVGDVILSIVFQNSSGATISTTSISAPLSGVTPTMTRFNTATVQIPTGTVSLAVTVAIGGTTVDIPVGSTININHFLLEEAVAGQTVPSAWADIDVQGHILDIFTLGSSTALRVQGSVLPTITGTFGYNRTDTTLQPTWTGLTILWPDGAITSVQDGSDPTVTGLSASTTYVASLYFDIVLGQVMMAPPSAGLGTPPLLSAALDPIADAYCKLDTHIPLTPGGFTMVTVATGSGGGGGVPPSTPPVTCTVRGTRLVTPDGTVSNELLKYRFDRGEDVYLIGREGPERIKWARWVPVDHWYLIEVLGMIPFGASESMTLKPAGGRHQWCSLIPEGTPVDTVHGDLPLSRTRLDGRNEVLFLELEGPSHEYLVEDGVWTHNYKISPIDQTV